LIQRTGGDNSEGRPGLGERKEERNKIDVWGWSRPDSDRPGTKDKEAKKKRTKRLPDNYGVKKGVCSSGKIFDSTKLKKKGQIKSGIVTKLPCQRRERGNFSPGGTGKGKTRAGRWDMGVGQKIGEKTNELKLDTRQSKQQH